MNSNNYWLIAVGVLAVVIVMVAAAIYFQTATPAPLSAAKSFIASIETERYETAYSKYHADLKEQESFPRFLEAWEPRSPSLREANASWSTDIEEQTAEVTGSFRITSRQDWSAVFTMVNQDDTWQIVGYELIDEPPD